MKKISFTIRGNHLSSTGNAVPKLKMTGKQSWTDKAQEYVLWKEYVVRSLLKSMTDDGPYIHNINRYKRPIVLSPVEHAYMRIWIKWSNIAHGDPENIFGSIADALFKNDKNLDCMTFSEIADEKNELGKPQGLVNVDIYIFPSPADKKKFIKNMFNF